MKLKIGKIAYLNMFPIFHFLQGELNRDVYEFVESYPARLNTMLRKGELDVSPSSSIEYLRDPESYVYLADNSISARGAVRSILLFSRVPIESLGGHEVMVTHQSETSSALLEIILSKFYNLQCTLNVTSKPVQDAIVGHSAYLSIGDEALFTLNKANLIESGQGEEYVMCSMCHQAFYVYDLGRLWSLRTGLPMVFALWIARKETLERKGPLFNQLITDLNRARLMSGSRLEMLSRQTSTQLPPEAIHEFWKGITYDLPVECVKGLELFGKYLKEIRG